MSMTNKNDTFWILPKHAVIGSINYIIGITLSCIKERKDD